MAIRDLILQDLENLLNTNAQGIDFVLGRPAVIYNADFAIERVGNNWYEVVTEDFIPVTVNSLTGGFLSQPSVKAISVDTTLSFLIPFEKEQEVLSAVNDFADSLPGYKSQDTDILAEGYSVVYNSTLPDFVEVQIYNDIRFIQYNITINALALQETFSLHNISVSLFNSTMSANFIELPVISYNPSRMKNTTVIQQPNTSASKSVAKNSAWTCSVAFFVSNKTELAPLTSEMLDLLENSTVEQNKVYSFRVAYPNGDSFTKPVIITGVQSQFSRDEVSVLTIMLEEAYTEVL